MITVSGNTREELIKQLAEIGLFIAQTANAPAPVAAQSPSQPTTEADDSDKPENLRRVRGENANKLFAEMAAKLTAAPIANEADLLAFATSVATDLARLPTSKADEFSALLASRKAALPPTVATAPTPTPAPQADAVAVTPTPSALPPFTPTPVASPTLPQPHHLDSKLQATAAGLEGAGWPRTALEKLIEAATGHKTIHTLPLDEDGALRRHRLNFVFGYCSPGPNNPTPWAPAQVEGMALADITKWLEDQLPLAKVKELALQSGSVI
jgi:hypothetical protein